MIEHLKNEFQSKGSFLLQPTQDIKKVVLLNSVPNDFGIYLIFKINDANRCKDLIYIGKAGSISNDGSRKRQGIRRRLVNQHSGENRTEYFLKYMDENKTSLLFEWYVTFDDTIQLLPAFVEAKLIQEFFINNNKLPELNKSF